MEETNKRIKKGESLKVALSELEAGETLTVPFRLFSENCIRVMVSNFKLESGRTFKANCRSASELVVTRMS